MRSTRKQNLLFTLEFEMDFFSFLRGYLSGGTHDPLLCTNELQIKENPILGRRPSCDRTQAQFPTKN